MLNMTLFNGAAAFTGGFYSDRHGHRVYVCSGQLIPGCPQYPSQTTYWRLDSEVPCMHDHGQPPPEAA